MRLQEAIQQYDDYLFDTMIIALHMGWNGPNAKFRLVVRRPDGGYSNYFVCISKQTTVASFLNWMANCAGYVVEWPYTIENDSVQWQLYTVDSFIDYAHSLYRLKEEAERASR